MPLDPARWARVSELFEGALALPEGARATFLSAHAGEDVELRREVESLLEYAPILGDPLTTVVDDVLQDAAEGLSVLPLQRIGPYRVQSEIGTGGMGSVYLADRDGEDFQQRVALKLVRGLLSVQGLRRFRAERRILAALHHPSIARLLDGGSTDAGVPYLVMEYVDGLPIDQYCAARELTIRDRLALFCRVCEAVAYAHRQLVVHRDLKPSNILVTADGTPKLLDFGIAKLMDDDGTGSEALHTSPSMRLLTPDYASPEQIRGGAVTTGSDVYSLGVLLFELLTGERPHRFNGKALDAIAREIIERDAPAPSSVASGHARLLRGDLDTITLAALQKDPQRRYATVEHLAEDVGRFIGGHPIHARPATWGYRTQRFVSRNRMAVVAAGIFVVTIGAMAGALVQSAQRAEQERDSAEQVTRFMTEQFRAITPATSRGNEAMVREILDKGVERVNREFSADPIRRAALLEEIGSAYLSLGLADRSQRALEQAVDARTAAGDLDSLTMAATMVKLAESYNRFNGGGHVVKAEGIARAALDIRRRYLSARDIRMAEARDLHARTRMNLGGRWDAVEPDLRAAIAIWSEQLGPDAPQIANALRSIAGGRRSLKDAPAAELAIQESLRIALKHFTEDDSEVMAIRVTQAEILELRGRLSEAETMLRELLARRRKLFGPDHPTTQQAVVYLTRVLIDQGKIAEAEPLVTEAISVWRKYPNRPAGPMYRALNDLGRILDGRGRAAEADPLFAEAVEIVEKLFPPALLPHGHVVLAQGEHWLHRARPADALAAADRAIATRRQYMGDDHPDVADGLILRARALAALGRLAEARAAYQDGVERQRVLAVRYGLPVTPILIPGVN